MTMLDFISLSSCFYSIQTYDVKESIKLFILLSCIVQDKIDIVHIGLTFNYITCVQARGCVCVRNKACKSGLSGGTHTFSVFFVRLSLFTRIRSARVLVVIGQVFLHMQLCN